VRPVGRLPNLRLLAIYSSCFAEQRIDTARTLHSTGDTDSAVTDRREESQSHPDVRVTLHQISNDQSFFQTSREMTEHTDLVADYWLVIDLEATCCNDGQFPREEMEIIEIGAVIAEGKTFQPMDEFQTFVRPVRHKLLTDFCRELTGIEQSDIAAADEFPEAMGRLTKWMADFPGAVFCSWGEYDRRQFERDCGHHDVEWPFGTQHVNLKKRYADRFRLKRGEGFGEALRNSDLTFEGRPHRGIDDARNIARLMPTILET
jgi:inhibitor of KinA sporulation pathway (predicted exonuclease)